MYEHIATGERERCVCLAQGNSRLDSTTMSHCPLFSYRLEVHYKGQRICEGEREVMTCMYVCLSQRLIVGCRHIHTHFRRLLEHTALPLPLHYVQSTHTHTHLLSHVYSWSIFLDLHSSVSVSRDLIFPSPPRAILSHLRVSLSALSAFFRTALDRFSISFIYINYSKCIFLRTVTKRRHGICDFFILLRDSRWSAHYLTFNSCRRVKRFYDLIIYLFITVHFYIFSALTFKFYSLIVGVNERRERGECL